MAESFQAPGVYVRELRAGIPQIRGVPTSVGAMLGRTPDGPANKKVRINSFPQFQRIYGTFDSNSYLAESVDAFFKNGGSAVYINRVLGTGGGGSNVKASFQLVTNGPAGYGEILTGANAFPVALAAGDTFIGKVGAAGAAGTATVAATAATKTLTGGSYAAGAATDSVTISRTVMGVTIVSTIDLSSVGATQADYLAALNSVSGMQAVEDGSDIVWSTDQKGSGAAASITAYGGAAQAKLGGPAAPSAFTNAGPNNVANQDQVTAAEWAAMIEAVANLGTGATAAAVTATQASWKSDTAGASPNGVQFTGGTGTSKITGLDLLFHAGVASTSQDSQLVEAVGEGPNGNSLKVYVANEDTKVGLISTLVASGSVTQIALTAATIAKVNVGDTLKFVDLTTSTTARGVVKQIKDKTVVFTAAVTLSGNLTVANTTVTSETFNLTVFRSGFIVQGPMKFLRVSSLSPKNYFVTRVNTDNDENLITATDSSAAIGASLDVRPVNTVADGDLLTGGDEQTTFLDTDYIGAAGATPTGLYVFDKVKDIRLMAIPGITGSTSGAVSKALVDYCTARQDCFAIIEPPLGTTVANAVTYKNDNVGGTSYGAMYFPWVQIIDPLTSQPSYSPPSGYVMGMYARTDRERGIHKAPAGELTGRLAGTIGLELELSDDDRAQLYPANINPIQNISGIGQCVMGSRTLETGEFNQINVRRTFIYLEQSIKQGTTFVLFEPNDAATRAKVRRTVSAFLSTEWKKGTLEGDTFSDAFYVTCDDSNNPKTVINDGKMVIATGVNIPRATEFLIIEVQQDQRGAEASVGA